MQFLRRAALVALTAILPVGAQTLDPKNPFALTPQQLFLLGLEAAEGEDDDIVALLIDRRIRIEADGSSSETSYIVYRALTEDGAEAWDSVSASWSPWRQDKPVIRARVISPDRAQTDLDPSTIADSAASSNRDSIYRDTRVIRAPLPAMEKGVVVERIVETHSTQPLFEAGEVQSYFLNQSIPVKKWRLIVDAPAGTPIHHLIQLAPDLSPVIERDASRQTLTFEAGPLEPYEDPESSLPKDQPRYAMVSYATGESWAHLSETYNRIIDEKVAGAAVEELAQQAVEGVSGRADRIRALVKLLHERIRYTGIEFGRAGLIPYPPDETLGRRYGDCKDKSTVLIAMLRAVGVPAYLAMLRTGPGLDVAPELPGMGRFDHAIVYVPGEPDYWIDATSEFSKIESPPLAVQGRYALVAAPSTAELTTIPKAPSSANRVVETRHIVLSEIGRSEITEDSAYFGAREASARADFDSYDPDPTRESLEEYVEQVYLANKLDDFSIGDSKDLSQDFRIRLEVSDCGRAVTETARAVAAIRLDNLVQNLPSALTSPPEEDDDPREGDYLIYHPFVYEWRYRIEPPSGFELRELPPDETREIGPMLYSASFSAEDDGSVTGTLKLDTRTDRLTAAEVAEVQKGAKELAESDAIMIWFDHPVEAMLEAGEIAQALPAMKALVAESPDRAIPLTRLARAYLAAGLGEAARTTAQRAIEAEPESAVAHQTLASIYEYDLIGRRFRKGFDREQAIRHYERALELDPENDSYESGLAILLEHGETGVRYRQGAQLDEAIKRYRNILERKEYPALRKNLIVAYMKAERFDQMREAIEEAASKTQDLWALDLLAMAVLEGSEAALTHASQTLSEENRRTIVNSAAQTLLQERRYQHTAEFFTDLAADLPNASQVLGQAAVFAKMKRWESLELDPGDPQTVVTKFFLVMFGEGDRDDLYALFSRHSQDELESPERMEELDRELRKGRTFDSANMSADLIIDLLTAARESTLEGDDEKGYSIRQSYAVANNTVSVQAFILKEGDKYVILDAAINDEAVLAELPLEVFARLDRGDREGASHLVDWAADAVTDTRSPDPLAGSFFHQIWAQAKRKDPNHIRYAAAALLASGEADEALQAVPILQEAVKKSPKKDRLPYEAALHAALLKAEQWEDLFTLGADLHKRYPDSEFALVGYLLAAQQLARYAEALSAIDAEIKRKPDEPLNHSLKADVYLQRGEWDKLLELLGPRIDNGIASETDPNNYAWASIAKGTADDRVAEIIEKSALEAQDTAVMNTQALVYAELGRNDVARQIILQALDIDGYEEPNSDAWLVLGRIAQNYGEPEVAARAYKLVERPDKDTEVPSSSYSLAQKWLKEL